MNLNPNLFLLFVCCCRVFKLISISDFFALLRVSTLFCDTLYLQQELFCIVKVKKTSDNFYFEISLVNLAIHCLKNSSYYYEDTHELTYSDLIVSIIKIHCKICWSVIKAKGLKQLMTKLDMI